MRRTAAVVVALLAGCSSSGGSKAASSGQSTSGASASTSSGPTTTLSPADQSAISSDGARAFLTIWANGLRSLDRTVTQAQVDCIPGAVLTYYTADEFFALIRSKLGQLGPDDVTKVTNALHACGFSDEQVKKANLS